MRVMRLCCLLSAVLLTVTACVERAAKNKPLPSGATLAEHGIVCREERATGSLIGTTVCTTPAQRQRHAEQVQQTKDAISNQKAGPCPPTGPCS
jgi:hypothetical protein